MQGNIAIVTGGASGIGAATVRLFREKGMIVHAFDRNKDLLAELYDGEDDVFAHVVDMSDGPSVRAAITESATQSGGIDVLVNAAGVVATSPETNKKLVEVNLAALASMQKGEAPSFDFLEITTDEEFDRVMRINLYSMFYAIQAVAPIMRERGGGAIVNFSSVSALVGQPMPLFYPASKAGVLGMTRAAAGELSRYKIRVNAIAPGAVDTPILRDQPAELVAFLTSMQPIGRTATPEELAETVLFLSDDQKSGYYTGQVLNPNGGFKM